MRKEMAEQNEDNDNLFIKENTNDKLQKNKSCEETYTTDKKYFQQCTQTQQATTNMCTKGPSRSTALMELPPELVLHIFSFLKARFTICVLCQVCKLFNHLLSSEASWKTRFGTRWPKRDRKEDYEYVVSWKKVCVDHEDMDRFWKNPMRDFDFYQLRHHFAPVDSAIIIAGGRLCVSASRDRSIGIWDLSSLREHGDEQKALVNQLDGHKGWVWCLASDPTGAARVSSGSWDNSVKIWDLQSETVEMTTIREHKAAVLCMDWKQDVLTTGCYDKRVRMFDLRDSNVVADLKYHTKPVLCLLVDDHYIITGSEDKTMCIYDRRAASIYKVLQLSSSAFCICRSSSAGYNYLRIGGKEGQISLFDATKDSFQALEPIVNPEYRTQGKICGLCHYGGAIVAASSDHSIQVLEPSRVPTKIFSFDNHNEDVASVHSSCGILASASSDATVGIWRPKSLSPL